MDEDVFGQQPQQVAQNLLISCVPFFKFQIRHHECLPVVVLDLLAISADCRDVGRRCLGVAGEVAHQFCSSESCVNLRIPQCVVRLRKLFAWLHQG
jgi:hypothetical protein